MKTASSSPPGTPASTRAARSGAKSVTVSEWRKVSARLPTWLLTWSYTLSTVSPDGLLPPGLLETAPEMNAPVSTRLVQCIMFGDSCETLRSSRSQRDTFTEQNAECTHHTVGTQPAATKCNQRVPCPHRTGSRERTPRAGRSNPRCGGPTGRSAGRG